MLEQKFLISLPDISVLLFFKSLWHSIDNFFQKLSGRISFKFFLNNISLSSSPGRLISTGLPSLLLTAGSIDSILLVAAKINIF